MKIRDVVTGLVRRRASSERRRARAEADLAREERIREDRAVGLKRWSDSVLPRGQGSDRPFP